MDLSGALRTRRSVRAFRGNPIPDELLCELVRLANAAPSAGNLQSRDFVIVRDPQQKRGLAEAADQAFIAEAPAVLVVCTDASRVTKYGKRGRDLYMIQDAAAATENFLLAAHERGLGTVWIGAFDEEAVRRTLGLPPHVRPVSLVPVGRPAEIPEDRGRLPLAEILHWDRW